MRFGSRSRPRVRVHEAYLACVLIFLTHIGDRHDASCTPRVLSSRRDDAAAAAVGVCVIVPIARARALCDNKEDP